MNGLVLGILNNEMSIQDFLESRGVQSSFVPDIQLLLLQLAFGNTSHAREGAIQELEVFIARVSIFANLPLVGKSFNALLKYAQSTRELFDCPE